MDPVNCLSFVETDKDAGIARRSHMSLQPKSHSWKPDLGLILKSLPTPALGTQTQMADTRKLTNDRLM